MLADIHVEIGAKLIREFLNEIRDELIAYLDSNDRNATGRSKNSLQVANVTNNTGQLQGSDSIEFVFRGRAPGKMPPLFAIIEWCSSRGLPRNMAWVIAKRIAESGTKLYRQKRNILNEVITEKKIQEFADQYADIYSAQIKSDIESLLAA